MTNFKSIFVLAIFTIFISLIVFGSQNQDQKLIINRQIENDKKGKHPVISGSNLFLHKIISGTCASNGFDSIINDDICSIAVSDHGYDVYSSFENQHQRLKNTFYECSVKTHRLIKLKDLFSNEQVDYCDPKHMNCQCSPLSPCFCSTRYYVDRDRENIHRKNQANGQFVVTWDLSLGGQESLLESAFLKAAFEQSVKDYINNDIRCSDDLSVKGAEFFGVEIPDIAVQQRGLRRAVSGNGKCKGDISKCKVPIKAKKKKQTTNDDDDDDSLRRRDLMTADQSRVVKATHTDDEFCEVFLSSTIFDAFKERLLTASAFNYNVDVDVINQLEGNLDLKYDVKFEPAPGGGLDQVEDLDGAPDEPVAIDTVCSASQCFTQRDVMRQIFAYFGLPFDEEKHECLYQGINCDTSDMVTHIWMVNYGFSGKTIPDFFQSLPSLQGLFLGGNELIGTIPSRFSLLKKLKLLWLENNKLTGSIPSQIGNLRGLLELNLNGNDLSGTIPTEIGRLSKIRMINIGSNAIRGSIPSFSTKRNVVSAEESGGGCHTFPNPFNRIDFGWLRKRELSEEALLHLTSLSLYGNKLSGPVPSELALLVNLGDLSLSDNDLTGEIPTIMFQLRNLNVLDLHGNAFTGTFSEDIGHLQGLKILNFFGNGINGTIPTNIGKLTQLNELVLDDNFLTGPIPSELGKLSKLRYLTFGGNEMSGEIPTELGNLALLDNLDLRDYSIVTQIGNKKITGTIPSELGLLKNWKYVVFQNNGAAGTIPSEFGNLASSKALWLKNQELSGSIPTELGILQSLSLLSVGNNSLEGTLPPSLGNITSLKELELGSNNLTGDIPTELANLSNLNFINIGNQKISGTLPTELGKVISLEFFFFEDTGLEGGIPSEYGNLTNIKMFSFAGSDLSGSLSSELGNLVELTTLNLSDSSLVGTIPTELGKLGNLTTLDLNMNELTGQIPSEFGMIQTLEIIHLCENKLSGSIPTEIFGIPALIEITLCDNEINGLIPTDFGVHTRSFRMPILSDRSAFNTLQKLDIGSNKLSGDIPSEIGLISGLTDLVLGQNGLAGEVPTEIGNLNLLRNLDVEGNMLIGGIPSEIGQLTELVFLKLGGNEITGTIPTEFGNLKSLAGLSLIGCTLSGSIPSELGLLDSLFFLNLGGNSFTGSVPIEIQNLEGLETLNISGTNLTGDISFVCGLSSYELEDPSVLDCSDWCGTVHEECNSSYIGDAKCTDVDCRGPGEPFCTEKCRLDYSSCSTSTDQTSFQLDLFTDSNGRQTSWKIRDGDDTVIWQSDGFYFNFLSYREFGCMENDCYEFELLDSGGDGICCGENSGDGESYSILVDGVALCGTGESFGSSIIHNIGSCASLCPFKATSMPSSYPATVATQSPSLDESISPSSLPSQKHSAMPSESPSLAPSIVSSYRPSGKRSSSPSFYPSTLSSMSPSSTPSKIPTVVPSISHLPTMDNFVRPSLEPSLAPSIQRSSQPSIYSSEMPSLLPSLLPSVSVSSQPTLYPSRLPSFAPSLKLSSSPSLFLSSFPSVSPSSQSSVPSDVPSLIPSSVPSAYPSLAPSNSPSSYPSVQPSLEPSFSLSSIPSWQPSSLPSLNHSQKPSLSPSSAPSRLPSMAPSIQPSSSPSIHPSIIPSLSPSFSPSENASLSPSLSPSAIPSFTLSENPTGQTVTILVDPIPLESARFGVVLGISGDSLYISAPNTAKGRVCQFSLNGTYIDSSSGVADSDDYGEGLAVLDDLIVIGAAGKKKNKGETYIISKPNVFSDITLDPSDSRSAGAQHFGSTIAISSGGIVIAADLADLGGIARGAVYLFDISGNEQAKIVAPSAESFDNAMFGERLTMSDDNIFVASYRQESNKGAVHIFDLSGSYVFSLKGEATGDKFGFGLHVFDTTLVVGAVDASNANGVACGVAYMYTLVGSPVTSATLVSKVESDDGVVGDQFGAAVLITTDTIYIGSDQNTNLLGAVYKFSRSGVQSEKIFARGAVAGDRVGHSIAVSGTTMVFGAPGRVVNGLARAGAVFVIGVG